MMVKDLKALAAGTEVKGFPLLIKTARKTFKDAVENVWQEVVFMDASGEMLGHIAMEGNTPWQSKTNLCIMEATIQDTDERRKETMKLVVTDCFDAATPITFDQDQDLSAEDWRLNHENEIKGKIRHGIVCSMIRAGDRPSAKDPKVEKYINAWVDFIMTGE